MLLIQKTEFILLEQSLKVTLESIKLQTKNFSPKSLCCLYFSLCSSWMAPLVPLLLLALTLNSVRICCDCQECHTQTKTKYSSSEGAATGLKTPQTAYEGQLKALEQALLNQGTGNHKGHWWCPEGSLRQLPARQPSTPRGRKCDRSSDWTTYRKRSSSQRSTQWLLTECMSTLDLFQHGMPDQFTNENSEFIFNFLLALTKICLYKIGLTYTHNYSDEKW